MRKAVVWVLDRLLDAIDPGWSIQQHFLHEEGRERQRRIRAWWRRPPPVVRPLVRDERKGG